MRPSRRNVHMLDDEGFVELVISNATLDDGGIYKCTATNDVGKVDCTCTVTIESHNDNGMIIPTFCEPNMPYSNEPQSFDDEGDTVKVRLIVSLLFIQDYFHVCKVCQ